MARSVVVALVTFLVGLVGLLGEVQLHLEYAALVVATVVLGAIAVAFSGERRAAIGFVAMTVGMLAAYPAGLALGTIGFLGDAWQIAAAVLLAAGSVGFLAYRLTSRALHSMDRRPA